LPQVTSAMQAAYSEQQLFAMHDVHWFAPRRSLQMLTPTAAQTPPFASGSHTHARPEEHADAQRSQQAFATVPVGSARQTPPLAQSALVEQADEQTPGIDSKFEAKGKHTPAVQSAPDWHGSPSSPDDPPPSAAEHPRIEKAEYAAPTATAQRTCRPARAIVCIGFANAL
jgi:hypothetical protein